ncbi:MAG: TonB-dependent receptor [Saprospiraceae bacterium]|nr:TonB-dependent receptor [Saprospiraceae bacterium]
MKKLLQLPFSGMKTFLCFTFFIVCTISLSAQQVSGTIKDNTGSPVVGASVLVKGTNNGTVTDENGVFNLNNVTKGATLVVSFVGFKTQEITEGGNLTITLEVGDALDEVVVTGVFDARTKMSASVAISTINAKQIERLAATSAGDLLKNIPGVYVNQARGEIWNTVYSRGISAGSIDNVNGYYYVSMQEDGLPVTNINSGVDYFLRADATTDRVEAVRGGTASILGANAPGGIFNYVSKTGGKTFAGEFRAKFGLEGNGKNPYYRADINLGGPLSNGWTYNVGGFLRQSNGARYPGYPMNNGGQLRANVLKTYGSGSLKIYAKYLNDKNALTEFTPTQGWTDPKIPTGFSAYDSYYLPDVTVNLPINGKETRTFKSKDKIHSQDKTVGFNWVQRLGEGLTLKNDARFSSKNVSSNVPAVVTPFATDGLLFYAIPHLLGKFGTYTFTDKVTNQVLGTVTQAPNIINGNFAGFKFTPGANNNFPGANVQKNSLFFLPLFYSTNDRTEFADQISLSKKLNTMNFTLGAFYSTVKFNSLGSSQDFGIGVGTMQDQPHLTDIKLQGFDGKTYQITDPNGFMDVGRDGVNLSNIKRGQVALFFGHDWQINQNLNFDWGIRYENTSQVGSNTPAVSNPKRNDPTYGGLDNNPLTVYDNGGGTQGTALPFDYKVATFSFSGGLNYKLSDNQALYIRYSNGNKAPDIAYQSYAVNNKELFAQKVVQLEGGYKVSTEKVKFFATPFYSVLSNVPNVQTFTDTTGLTYTPTIQFAKYTTVGIELEASYAFTKNWLIKGNAVIQKSKANTFKTWAANANGKADDKLNDYSGKETDNNAGLIFNINPIYNGDKFYASLNFSYMGKRQANVLNAFQMPAFSTVDLSLGYDISAKFRLQANVNNVLNTYGVLGWTGPGGFPAALDRQGFTPEFIAANPNAIYSTQGNMPRAYFLTASYKF